MDVWGTARVRILQRRHNLTIELTVDNRLDHFDVGHEAVRRVRASNVTVKIRGRGAYGFLKFEPANQDTNLPEEIVKALEAMAFDTVIDDEELYIEAKG